MMSIEWAREELSRRRNEQADTEAAGTWDAYAEMKRKWKYRRKEMGFGRATCRAWLEIAEAEMSP